MGTVKGYNRPVDAEWQRRWAYRLAGALCKLRLDLPWTADEEPARAYMHSMLDVCLSCPVRLACADYALDRALPAQGGMYAGVWIPWQPANGATEMSNRTKGWLDARHKLRLLRAKLTEDMLRALSRAPSVPTAQRNGTTRVAAGEGF